MLVTKDRGLCICSIIFRLGQFHLQKKPSNCWLTAHQQTGRDRGATWQQEEKKDFKSIVGDMWSQITKEWQSNRNEMESLIREGDNNMNI